MRVRTMIMKAGFWHYCFIFASVMATLVMNPAFANPGLPKCPSVGFLHDCTGSFNYSDGAKYDGEWRHDRKHGQGTFTFPDGGEYIGEWKYGNKYGQGTYTFPDGEIYTGAWGADKKNGQGKHTFPDGTVEEGTWKGGELLKPKQVASPASGSPEAKRILKDIDVLLENAGSLIREDKLSEAVELVLDCSNNGVVKCMMFRAYVLQDEGKHEDARAIYLKAAEKGVAEAYGKLSILSYRTTDDFLYYRQKAADKGYFRSKMDICNSQLFGYDSEEAAIVLTDMISGVECYRKLKLIKITDRIDQSNLDRFIEDFIPNSLFDETQRNVKVHNLEEEAAYAKSYFYDVVDRDLKKHKFWLDRTIEINNEELHQRLSRVYLNLPEKINSAGKDYWNKYSEKSNLNQDSTLIGVNPVVADSGLPKCPSGVFHNCTGHKNGYVGEWKDGKKSGQGTFTYSDGVKYVGEWKDNRKHGQGTITYPDGKKYVGEWKDDKFNGQGTLTFSDGRKYVGEFKDSKQNGQGTYTYRDGGNYAGEWKNDKYNGQGTYTFWDGAKYVGEWKNDKYNGQGTYTFPDGAKYVGEWKNSKQNGQGAFTYPNGRKDVGDWKNGKFSGKYVGERRGGKYNGKGTFTYPDGANYVGEWKDDYHNGQGTFTYSDGTKYAGEWKDDYQNGQGTFTYSDGRKYVGQWEGGKKNGKGTLALRGGRKYEGEFKDNKRNGQGALTYLSGVTYVGQFKDDYFNGLGTYTYRDGGKYTGQWKDSRQNGQGTFTSLDGEKYVGQWKDWKKNGQGTFTSLDGEKYVGEWKDDRFNGQGTFTYLDGRKYVGEWKDGKENGQGTFTSLDGEKYVGEWKDGKENGQGTLTYLDGEKYVGEWKDGKENGQGTLTYLDGEKYVGEWKDGKHIGQGTLTYPDGERLASTLTSSDQGSLATSKKKKTSSWCWINCDPTEAELRDLFIEGLKIIESDMSDPLKTGLFGAFTSAFKTDIKITLKKFKKDWCKKQSDVLYLCQIYTVVGYSTSNREFGNYLTLMGLANKDDSTTQEIFIEKTESGWAVRD